MDAHRQHGLDEAFERIEESILPSISMMLDTLLDAATLGKPGVDAEIYAAEIRTIGHQLEGLIQQVESLSATQAGVGTYRNASAA